MVFIFSSPGRFYFVSTGAATGCAVLFFAMPRALCYCPGALLSGAAGQTQHRARKSSATRGRCFTGTVAPSATYSESLELILHFLALISGTKVNWDNSEFTPISLRGWFKNTCNVSFKIISFDWKYLEMFLSTGFKRCHFFMNAETLINQIPKALTQLSGLQLFLFLLLLFVKINAIKKNPSSSVKLYPQQSPS